MTDVFTKSKRSQVMSAIRGRGNKGTELRLISIMRQHGIKGWRRNYALFGRPDFVFPKSRLAVFVDGCFWHCCPIHSVNPKSNSKFWKDKFQTNKTRDLLVNKTLKQAGWLVLRIWEHALIPKNENQLVKKILKYQTNELKLNGK
jgi:DNA mismatch endonuclease, patch repair protein